MIPDKDTNIVYLSQGLRKEHPQFFQRFTTLMTDVGISWDILKFGSYLCPMLAGEGHEVACVTCAKLASLDIDFTSVSHEPIMTMEEGEAIAERLGVRATKNLFLVNRQGEHFLLLLRGDKMLRTKELARQIGSSHLSFASADDLEEILSIEQGAVSILALMFDKEKRVRLLIDKDVLEQEYIGCHPCVNTCSLRLRMRDVLDKFLPATGHTITEVVI